MYRGKCQRDLVPGYFFHFPFHSTNIVFPTLFQKIDPFVEILPFTFKDHKIFVLNFWLKICNRCVRKCRSYLGTGVLKLRVYMHDTWLIVIFMAGRFLPQQILPL